MEKTSLLNYMAVWLYNVVVFATSSFLYQTVIVHVIFCNTLVTPCMNHIFIVFCLFELDGEKRVTFVEKKTFLQWRQFRLVFKILSPLLKQVRVSELKYWTIQRLNLRHIWPMTTHVRQTTPKRQSSSDSVDVLEVTRSVSDVQLCK